MTFDWFQVATPFFMALLLLSLVALKLSLRTELAYTSPSIGKLKLHQIGCPSSQQMTLVQRYDALQVLNYLLQNHSIVELFLTRKSKNKLSMILSLSTISVLCVHFPNVFVNCFVGVPIGMAFILAQISTEQTDNAPDLMEEQ
jgi:ABC-type siderophore export system fused ATPase/permease subunit